MKIKSEEQKEKKLKNSEQSLKGLWDPSRRPTYNLWQSQKENKGRKGQREYLKK